MLRTSNISAALLVRSALVACVALALGASTLGLAGCSSDGDGDGSGGGNGGGGGGGNGQGGGNGDGGGGGNGEGGGGGGADAGTDSAAAVVNSCKTFVDRSAAGASRSVPWDFGVSTAPERCMTVKKGQDVTFTGDFVQHPLEGSGGDKPNPISSPDAAGKVSFTTAGTFGFVCGLHPAMTGAIQVIE